MPAVADRLAQHVVAGGAAELVAHEVVVDHVVAVRRAGRGGERRRDVDVGDAELGEIGHERGGVGEAEVGCELQAIGGERAAWHVHVLSTPRPVAPVAQRFHAFVAPVTKLLTTTHR